MEARGRRWCRRAVPSPRLPASPGRSPGDLSLTRHRTRVAGSASESTSRHRSLAIFASSCLLPGNSSQYAISSLAALARICAVTSALAQNPRAPVITAASSSTEPVGRPHLSRLSFATHLSQRRRQATGALSQAVRQRVDRAIHWRPVSR